MTATTIDTATFRALQDSTGTEFVRELVATFCEELPGMLGELRIALDRGDEETFRRTAHSLKSNSLAFGAGPLAALARDLELTAGAVVRGERPAALDVLAGEERRVRVALQDLARG
jgi:HPt (histidine-containing phosphotransfer) domain-containing protein